MAVSFPSNFSHLLDCLSLGGSALNVWSNAGSRRRVSVHLYPPHTHTHCRWLLSVQIQSHQRAVMWPVVSGRDWCPLIRSLWGLDGRECWQNCRVSAGLSRCPERCPLSTWGTCAEHTHVCSLGSGQCAWLHLAVCMPAGGVYASACQYPILSTTRVLQTLSQMGRDTSLLR